MADGRMLKKVISESRRVASLKSDTHRMLYTWCIAHLDIEGRLVADPDLFKGKVAPRLKHITPSVCNAALLDMAEQELIILYEIDGDRYLQLRNFDKHNKVRKDKEKPSLIPPPADGRELDGLPPADGQGKDKRREEKRREDNNARTREAHFEKFWNIYPKKKSKGDAEKAWTKINPNEHLVETILRAVQRAMTSDDWMKEAGKYIPYPATWLNRKGWEDEYTQTNGVQQPRNIPAKRLTPDEAWAEEEKKLKEKEG